MPELTLAGMLTVDIGCKNAIGGEQASANVDDRHTSLGRSPTLVASGTHDARHALGDSVVAAALTVWASMAKAGDRGVDDVRVDLLHCLVA